MNERKKVLESKLCLLKRQRVILQVALLRPKTVFLKAKFYHEEGQRLDDAVGDLVDEEEPSDEDPMSQAQQTKLMTQIVVVSELLRKITAKAQAEIEQLESRQSKFQKQLMDGDDIADALKQDIYERKDFSVKHSMGALAKEVSDYYSHGLFKIKDKPSVQIIRQWYNEFCKYQKFKQNLQGLRDRESFLEEFNYTRRFYLYLKYEKKLSFSEV